MFQLAIDIFTAPAAAFTRLFNKPTVTIPLLVLIAGVLATNFAYYAWVDQAFMIEELIESQDMNAEQERALRKFTDADGASRMLLVTTISSVIMTTLIQLLHASYFLVGSLFSGHKISYRHWLSLVCWTALPRFLSYLASIVSIWLAPDGKISPYEVNPLGLTSLFGINIENSGLQQLLANLDVTLLWQLVLIVIAFSQWTQRSVSSSVAITFAPFVAIFGAWAYFVV